MPYSHSYINRYQQCPLACYYHNELKLRKRDEGEETHHMAYSRAFHEALGYLYINRYHTGDTTSLLSESGALFLAGYPRQLAPDDLAKTRPNGLRALAEYVKRWKHDDKRWRILSTESLDRQDDGFVVKLDLVVQDVTTEQIYGIDHKVTGKYLNYDYWQQFEPNSQIVEYVRFIRERYGYCDGFIINAIALRYRQRANNKGEPAGSWFAFERQTFNVNGRQMEADLDSRRYWTERIEHSKATGVWGMNTSQCRFCEYRDLCKAGWFYPDDAELIDLNYHRICGKWFGEPLQPCTLDCDHEGEHKVVQIDPPAEIEVEV